MTTASALPSTEPVTARDYSLTGPSGQRAIEAGLASADWYRPSIGPARLQALMARTNGRAARDVALWLALLVGAGFVAFLGLGHWWAVPAFVVYGALYGGAADPRWHECGHGSAFRNHTANDVVYTFASFLLLREATLWRWSHVRHHSDTLVVGRDPEIAFQRPFRLRAFVPNVLNLANGVSMLRRMIRHASGKLDDAARDFVPPAEWRRVVWEARAYVAVLLGVVVWSISTRSVVPLLFVGLPSFYGVWLLLFFGLTQHAGLREDVLDHRLNTRTVYMNPVFRFLYLNMNYHVEHHLFPSVPYHALPALHAEIKDQLAPAHPSTISAYREIVRALRHQRRDSRWELPAPTVAARRAGAAVEAGVIEAGVIEAGVIEAGVIEAGVIGDSPVDRGSVDLGSVDLGSVDSVAPGGVRRVDVGARTFALCRTANGDHVLVDGLCTHGRAHLADGVIVGDAIECPKHNGRFDVRTGEPVRRPVTVAVRHYDVRVCDGRLKADLC